MMRRGLWQKQKHPPACLLCRYSHVTRQSIRPARISSPSRSSSIALASVSGSSLLHYQWSERPYSALAGPSGRGCAGVADLRTAPGPRGLASLGYGQPPRRLYSSLPSWATQQPSPQPSPQPAPSAADDGLLPHERAAKERAQAGARRAGDTGDRLLPRRVATRERKSPRSGLATSKVWTGTHKRKVRLPDVIEPPKPAIASRRGIAEVLRARVSAFSANMSEAIAAGLSAPQANTASHAQRTAAAPQGWATPGSTRESANSSASFEQVVGERTRPVNQGLANADLQESQPTDPFASLFPHELAAGQRTRPANQGVPNADPQSPRSADPFASLLPPEQDGREGASRSPRDALGRGSTSNSEPPSAEFPIARYPDVRSNPRIVSRPQEGQESSPPRRSDDGLEWMHLTRRRQAVARGVDLSRPANPNQLLGEQETLKKGKDPSSSDNPWKVLEENAAAEKSPWVDSAVNNQIWAWADDIKTSGSRAKPQGPLATANKQANAAANKQTLDRPSDSQRTPGVSADPWKALEQSAAARNRATVDRSADEQTWAWTKDYVKDTKSEGARTASETRAVESRRRDRRDDRHRSDERDDDDARVRRSDRPKGGHVRRRGAYDVDREGYGDDDFYEARRQRKAEKAERERPKKLAALEEAGPTPIFLPEYISVSNLAVALGQKVDVFVSQLEDLGFEEVSKDSILTGETAALVAQEYGFEPTVDTGEEEDLKPRPPPEDPSSLPLRPPVVTIMGHVDHGKTTLLDFLRKSSIVAQEHGGITQHIGAFSVKMSSGKQITFLDTPGHAAFLSMRQRGAIVTDMVILVVAADDSVMPQTLEAIKHARAAKVPIIVAINKIDKPEANVNRVKSDLATHGVEIEDYGGDVQVVCVSGKTGQGMGDLEESILTLSELLDIRAELDGMAEGWVLESTIKPIGRVATVLVKRGTLRPGDFIVAGRVHAKIRSLRNEAGVEIPEALPGTAVEILGWREPPEAGDMVLQAPDEDRAKAAVRYRQELKDRGEAVSQMAQQEQDRREKEREREEAAAAAAAWPGSATGPPAEESGTKYINFTVKGDVHGSVEAVAASLLEQGNNEVRARVLHAAPGQVNESDVEHAAVSGSTIINFNNPVPARIRGLAEEAGVAILEHNVIYHVIEDVKERLAAALPPLVTKRVVGEAEVLQIFPINLRGRTYKNIAGCRVNNGAVTKGHRARVLRGGEVVFEGVIETLKNVKKDVDEMKKGTECGLSFADWDELQQGDHIQVYVEVTEKRRL